MHVTHHVASHSATRVTHSAPLRPSLGAFLQLLNNRPALSTNGPRWRVSTATGRTPACHCASPDACQRCAGQDGGGQETPREHRLAVGPWRRCERGDVSYRRYVLARMRLWRVLYDTSNKERCVSCAFFLFEFTKEYQVTLVLWTWREILKRVLHRKRLQPTGHRTSDIQRDGDRGI